MFAWWISWPGAWLLWACVGGVGALWTEEMDPEDLLGQEGVAIGIEGMRVGPGMGGSALQIMGETERAQHFATQPTPQTAVIGSTVVLPCRVINKMGHLQWTKNGFGLGTERQLFGFSRYAMIGSDDEGDYSLRIQPVSLLDDGLFQCQVSASDGVPGIRSHAARLTVHVPPDPPVLTPAALNVTAGVPVILVCESSGGRPAPEIQWIDNSRRETIRTGSSVQTELLEDGKRVKVRSRLTFTPRRAHHNSSLTCLTSNQALNSPLTSTVHLGVYFPPEVRLRARSPLLVEGDDATFVCSAKANPDHLTYRWYHNSDILANETSRTLTLWRIGRSFHQDSVSCEVSNTVGAAKKTLSLQVRYGPAFRTLPRDVMAETGKKVTLRCDVASHPPPTIAWLRDASNQILGKGRDLVVRVRPKTAGLYVCVAHVQGFPDLRGTVRVLVKGPPTIVSAGEQEGRMGDTVSLECSTVSIPSPIRVTWTYKGREIDLTDPRYEVVVDRQEEGLRNVLVIHDADTHDFGAYNCSVVNEYGVARKQIRLNEEKKVPVVLVAGGVATLVVLALLAASLLLCNKRLPPAKEDTVV